MEILERISKQFNNKFDYLRVLSAEYNTLSSSNAVITFLYPENMDDMSRGDKDAISDFVKEQLQLGCDLKIKFKKSYLDSNLIQKTLDEYISKYCSSVFSYYKKEFVSITHDDTLITIVLELSPVIFHYFIDNGIKEKIKEYLEIEFIAQFIIEPKCNSSIVLDEQVLEERTKNVYENFKPQKAVERYEVYEPSMCFGGTITPMPELIKNQKIEDNKEKDSLILAGKISNFREGTYTSKKQKDFGEQKFYYSFTITDHTGEISCIHFANKTSKKKVINLKDGDSVLALGNLRNNNKGLSYSIKAISYCEIIKPEIIEEVNKEDDIPLITHIEDYKVVKPRPYLSLTQENIFEIPKKYSEYVMNNTFVIFDLETTGLDSNNDEIIEIGSLKIVNGKIKEIFQTLIQPINEIPDIITNLTGIDNEMVKTAPMKNDAIKDFFKFCEGTILGGYNSNNFDIPFLFRSGKESGLDFQNEKIDVMVLAKQKLYLPSYKLGRVVESLGIDLHNAHRALADATATAELFLKLNEIT